MKLPSPRSLVAGAWRAGLVLAFAVSAQAATYTYNPSVLDWFSGTSLPVFTKYVDKPDGGTFFVGSDMARLVVATTAAAAAGANPVGESAGATWAAPAGEQVTSITFTYGSVLSSNLNLVVAGGQGDYSTELLRISPSSLTDSRAGANRQTVTVTVPEGIVVTALQLRLWEMTTASAALGSGWESAIYSIAITTAPLSIPEPGSTASIAGLAGLLAAGLGLRRRARTHR